MTVTWRVNDRGYHAVSGCPFEHDNPDPQPECQCDLPEDYDGCPCCAPYCECEAGEWRAVIECRARVLVRVQLDDGTYTSCCSPEAHRLPVQWWSPLYGPEFIKQPSPFERAVIESTDRIYKYMYRDSRVEELATTIGWWVPKADDTIRYGVIEIDLAQDDDED